jgi:murein DD-endopeptidase MepM/ murein hydrolase activator NlpD
MAVWPRHVGDWGRAIAFVAWLAVVAEAPARSLPGRGGEDDAVAPAGPTPAAVPLAPRIAPSPYPRPTDPVRRLDLRLPTDNRALFDGQPEAFYMGVDRPVDGKTALVWQGGQFGFVRNPTPLGEETYFIRFHEGLDIAPTVRDNRGDPLDLVRSIADGRVVFVNSVSGASNYGLHVVIEHDWGYGTFYSLYAHLMRIEAEPGAQVRAGQTLGRLGYTGSGIDRRRAHLHLELNMLLSDRFEEWQRQNDPASLSAATLYHGYNLAGLDLAALYQSLGDQPGLSLPAFFATQEPYYRVLAPAGSEMPSVLRRYPWLNPHPTSPLAPPDCPSFEITLTASGLPLAMVPSALTTPEPVVTATVPFHGRHSWRTSGRLGGTGTAAELTPKGLQYIRLITGTF